MTNVEECDTKYCNSNVKMLFWNLHKKNRKKKHYKDEKRSQKKLSRLEYKK